MWAKEKEHPLLGKRSHITILVERDHLLQALHPLEKGNGYHQLENGFHLKEKELQILLQVTIIPMILQLVIKKNTSSKESQEERILKISSVILTIPFRIALWTKNNQSQQILPLMDMMAMRLELLHFFHLIYIQVIIIITIIFITNIYVRLEGP